MKVLLRICTAMTVTSEEMGVAHQGVECHAAERSHSGAGHFHFGPHTLSVISPPPPTPLSTASSSSSTLPSTTMSAEQEEYLAVLKASYDYEPQSEDEIEIKEDQLLLLIERTDDE